MTKNTAVFCIVIVFSVLLFGSIWSLVSDASDDIKDITTLVFVAGGTIISVLAAMTAHDARSDSKRSSDTAYEAYQLALSEAERTRERYRSDKGSLLVIQKDEMYIPLFAPGSLDQVYVNDKVYPELNYDRMTLVNRGIGTAKNINFRVDFENAYEFDRYEYGTDDIESTTNLSQQYFVENFFPTYWIRSKITPPNADGILQINVQAGDDTGTYVPITPEQLTERQLSRALPNYNKTRELIESKKLGTIRNVEHVFYIPENYRLLAQHFFLEQVMELRSNNRKAPNPRLRIRIDYVEEALEQMNDNEESKRVKVFEITCSEVVTVIEKPVTPYQSHTNFIMSCFYDVKMVYDLPLSQGQTREEERAQEQVREADRIREERLAQSD